MPRIPAVANLWTVALLAIGIGAVASGRLALGVLALVYGAWTVVWIVGGRSDSERTLVWLFVARPFFESAWILALVGVIIAGHRSLGWVILLPLALAWLGLGVAILIWHRRVRRSPDRPA